jgi:hypothetical protein
MIEIIHDWTFAHDMVYGMLAKRFCYSRVDYFTEEHPNQWSFFKINKNGTNNAEITDDEVAHQMKKRIKRKMEDLDLFEISAILTYVFGITTEEESTDIETNMKVFDNTIQLEFFETSPTFFVVKMKMVSTHQA